MYQGLEMSTCLEPRSSLSFMFLVIKEKTLGTQYTAASQVPFVSWVLVCDGGVAVCPCHSVHTHSL